MSISIGMIVSVCVLECASEKWTSHATPIVVDGYSSLELIRKIEHAHEIDTIHISIIR